MTLLKIGTKENSLTSFNPADEVAKEIERRGGCKDWPCDYACLRRGACNHEKNPKEAQNV